MKTLIAYYSRADENYFSGKLQYIQKGNTEVVAEIIKEKTDGKLFKIEQAKPYSKQYNPCIAEAQADQKRNARPELANYLDNIDEYDTVYLGYPNYWGTAPMAVFTFLEHYNFEGKTIIPFCTHEGSGLGHSVEDIKKSCPGAKVENGFAVHGSRVEKSLNEIQKHIK